MLTWTSRVGEFDLVLGWDMQTRALVPQYLPSGLRVTATYFGDATLEGCVDGADYTAWADNYKQSGGWCDGDFDNSGFIDGADYTAWADNYKQGCGTVPEPGFAVLLTCGGLSLLRRRARK